MYVIKMHILVTIIIILMIGLLSYMKNVLCLKMKKLTKSEYYTGRECFSNQRFFLTKK